MNDFYMQWSVMNDDESHHLQVVNTSVTMFRPLILITTFRVMVCWWLSEASWHVNSTLCGTKWCKWGKSM